MKIVYLDTYCEGGRTYEDYLENCEINGFTPCGEDSEDYWDWIREEIESDYEELFDNLKYAKINNNPCFVSGSVGRWDGRHTIVGKIFDNLSDAIKNCFYGGDDFEVYLEDGVVYVKALHHDGTNCFEIHILNEKGQDTNELDIDETCFGSYPKYLY